MQRNGGYYCGPVRRSLFLSVNYFFGQQMYLGITKIGLDNHCNLELFTHVNEVTKVDIPHYTPGYKLDDSDLVALCGGALISSDEPQIITSPGYPSNLIHPLRCRWTIDAPTSEQRVRLTMTVMDLVSQANCTNEFVEFRDTPMVRLFRFLTV